MKLKLVTRKRITANPHKRERARRAATNKRTSITLVVVKENPLQPRDRLYTKLPAMNEAITTILRSYGEQLRKGDDNPKERPHPHALIIHADPCAYGAVVWPRASDGSDVEEMQDAIAERDHTCNCIPLVMYLGARA